MIVLDASAVLAILFEEPGADYVAARAKGAALGSVNYSEILAKGMDRGAPRRDVEQQVRRMQLTIVPFGAELAEAAAELRGRTRALGLSLADRACLALAASLDAGVLTGDRAWAELDLGINVELIR